MHGGVKKEDLKKENLKALEAGMSNLQRHVENVQKFGIVPVVSINRFSADTEAEIKLVKEKCKALGVEALMADHWAMGGEGAADVARAVVKIAESGKSKLKFLYPDDMPLFEKIRTIAKEIYRAERYFRRQIGARSARQFRIDGLRQIPDLRRQDPIQLLDQSRRQGRADRSRHQCARSAAVGRRRIRGRDLRRDHDHAGPAQSAGRRRDRYRPGRQDRRDCSNDRQALVPAQARTWPRISRVRGMSVTIERKQRKE